MSQAFNAKRPRRRPIINITPLIDVLFLLLIFFLVSSTFREQLGIDVELPQAQSASQQEVETVVITVDESGRYYYGDREADAEQLRAALTDVVTDDPEAPIVVRTHGQASFEDWVGVVDLVRSVGGGKLILPTRPYQVESEENP